MKIRDYEVAVGSSLENYLGKSLRQLTQEDSSQNDPGKERRVSKNDAMSIEFGLGGKVIRILISGRMHAIWRGCVCTWRGESRSRTRV